MIPEIHIEDYNYGLDDSRIAKYPLPERDSTKLLHYKPADNGAQIVERCFRDLPDLLGSDTLMVFNDTKVVPARLHFQRESGAHIEIFCLEPVDPVEYNLAFGVLAECSWKCVIGNAKKWKDDVLRLYNPDNNTDLEALSLRATLLNRDGQTGIVHFSWQGSVPFSRVLELAGTVPIPPYLNRESEEVDTQRYQTVYAHIRGSVAAPTAGLHFTEAVLDRLKTKGIAMETVCLHVGAGTFLPVKSSLVSEHPMHREPFVVSKALIERLAHKNGPLLAVGTTSVRTLESLYYIGVSCLERGVPEDVEQWAPYTREYPYSTEEALMAIVKYLNDNHLENLVAGTRIIIVPGFRFRLVDKLVTNFHQPESTLILLVSAFVNGDWRSIYDFALKHNFRFLSYGDSSLLERE